MAWGGQFGTSSYPWGAIPRPIVQQYEGAQNERTALGAYGNLLYGPLSRGGPQLAAGQVMDPAAQALQVSTEAGGGAFAPPGQETAEMGNLFAASGSADAAQQAASQAQGAKAAQGISDVGLNLANMESGMQEAADKLQAAKNEAQAEQMKGFMDIANLLTSPTGLGANVVSLFGGPTQTSPGGWLLGSQGASGNPAAGGMFSSLLGGGGGGGVASLGAEGDILPSDIIGSGGDITGAGLGDLGSIFGSMGGVGASAGAADAFSYLADLAPFAAAL